MKTIFVLGPCFTPDLGKSSPARNEAYVNKQGEVRVYDSVMHGLTTCHILTPEQETVIRDAKPYSTVRL